MSKMISGRLLGARLSSCSHFRDLVGCGTAATPVTTNVYRTFTSASILKFELKDDPLEDDYSEDEPSDSLFLPDVAFAFDIDGVLYNGNEAVPGARKTLEWIRKQGMRYVFLSNGGGVHEDEKAATLAERLKVDSDDLFKGRIILSHTPIRSWDTRIKEKAKVLVTSAQPENSRQLLKEYGFKRVVTPADIIANNLNIYPFKHLLGNIHRPSSPLPDSKSASAIEHPYSRFIPGNALKIDHIFVWNDPRDWSLDIQLISDLLVSHKGFLGTISSLNGKLGMPNNGWQQDGQPEMWVSNLDFVWKTDYAMNRFGTGAFLEALQGVWRAVTKSRGVPVPLCYHALGKPWRRTFEYAHEWLLKATPTLPGSGGAEVRHAPIPSLRKVYMIGDNPESDIRGANEFKPKDDSEWNSILVRTGVYGATPEEPRSRYEPTVVTDDVVDAVVWALRNEGVNISRRKLLSGN